ncbi:MAG: ABC transporter ATP-binding protein [Enterovibrio sp.]
MALISIYNAQLAYGDIPLLDNAELILQPNERVCLVGRNGAGKSTLMKVLAGDVLLDDGTLLRQSDLKVARLEQDPPKESNERVFDYVAQGLAQAKEQLNEYHALLNNMENDASAQNIARLAQLQEEMERSGAWRFEQQLENVLSWLQLDGNKKLSELSGGWQRKAALARALVCQPDILLLDEPTNHLDVATILWLEQFLKEFSGTIVFISHDRAFIRSMATRIVDLDRGKLTSWPGNYEKYLTGKEEWLRVESEQNALFDQKLAQEEVWIRQGIKARRTRNEGRVRALKKLREERADRIERQGTANLQVDAAARSGKIVFEADKLTYHLPDKKLIDQFSFNVQRGDRIALIGKNGCGKSTLLKLMLQELAPQSGSLHIGTKLEVAYFDQYREMLDPEQSVLDNVAGGMQEVEVGGKRRHVMGYLQDFLFHPRRANTPVKALSGGEKNRLMLAKIFLKPCNVLILDEPTNDLDIETLELLEELLTNYEGTLLLVSHDRQFIDNTVTHSWVFTRDGKIEKFVGGYHDALAQQKNLFDPALDVEQSRQKAQSEQITTQKSDLQDKKQQKKLSYKLQRELECLPQLIEKLEENISTLQNQVNHPDFFQQEQATTQAVLQQLAQAQAELEEAFLRWEDLEQQKGS